MRSNLRGRIREFLQSEEGKVGVKGPLTLGVATGSLLLAQTIIGTSVEARTCEHNADCGQHGLCVTKCYGPPDEDGNLTCIRECA